VFVPMILDSEPKRPQGQLSLDIPPKENAPPLPPPAPSKGAAATLAPSKAEPLAKTLVPPETAKAIAAADPAKVVTASEPPKAVDSAQPPKLEGFAVQVGAFKDEDKLSQARQKLASAKIPHFVERRGDLNRLRAGPYSTREDAEKALASIKAASLNGRVVPLP